MKSETSPGECSCRLDLRGCMIAQAFLTCFSYAYILTGFTGRSKPKAKESAPCFPFLLPGQWSSRARHGRTLKQKRSCFSFISQWTERGKWEGVLSSPKFPSLSLEMPTACLASMREAHESSQSRCLCKRQNSTPTCCLDLFPNCIIKTILSHKICLCFDLRQQHERISS